MIKNIEIEGKVNGLYHVLYFKILNVGREYFYLRYSYCLNSMIQYGTVHKLIDLKRLLRLDVEQKI